MQQAGRDMRVHGPPVTYSCIRLAGSVDAVTTDEPQSRGTPTRCSSSMPSMLRQVVEYLVVSTTPKRREAPKIAHGSAEDSSFRLSVVSPAPGQSASLSIEECHSVCTLIKKSREENIHPGGSRKPGQVSQDSSAGGRRRVQNSARSL